MNIADCAETDADCFAKGILKRYKSLNIYTNCTVEDDTLISNGANTTQELFQKKIVYYLKLAKNELILKTNLEQKLAEYKRNFQNTIKSPVDAFVKQLNTINDKYMDLLNSLPDMFKYFDNSSKTNFSYQNFLSCSINFNILFKILILYFIFLTFR